MLTPSLSLVASPTCEQALPKEGKVRWLKAESQISANPRRNGIKYKHVHSALQHCHGRARPPQIPSTLQRRSNHIALKISSSTADYSLYRSLPGFCSLLSGELYLPIQLP